MGWLHRARAASHHPPAPPHRLTATSPRVLLKFAAWISTSPTSSPSCRPPSAASPRTRSSPGPARSTRPTSTRRTSSRSSATPGLLGLCIPEDLRRLGRRDPGPHHRHRGGLQVLQRGGPDAAAHPPADGPGDDRRVRGAEASATSRRIADGSQRAAFGLSEPQAGSDVMGMRTQAVPDGDGGWVLNGTKCWMSGVAQADWYTRVRQDVRRRHRPRPRLHHRLHRRAGLGRRRGRQHRPQDGRAGRRHRRAAAPRRARARRERHRRGRRLPAGHARPQLHAPDRRRPRHRPGRGRAHVRHRVREGAGRRSPRPSPTSRASSGRSPSWRPRSRRPACSPTGRPGWPTRASSPRSGCRTCRWPSTTPPSWR